MLLQCSRWIRGEWGIGEEIVAVDLEDIRRISVRIERVSMKQYQWIS